MDGIHIPQYTVTTEEEGMFQDDLLAGLNDAQKEAVTTTEGCVRVIAGAGSGKTRALSRRFAYLVMEAGILPENILCVTFTNKASAEMRSRIHRLTGDNDTGYINTFHGFCVSVLHEDSNEVQYPKNFLVLDNSDIDQMLEIIYEERNLTLRDMTYSRARDMIEIQKLKRKPDYYLDMIDMSLDALKQKYEEAKSTDDVIFYGYLYQEKKNFGLDYNDLIKFTLYIFRRNAEVRLKWQQRLEYIMIDEFQDIDDLQYELMRVLADYHRNLFIVGDPDQTIYTWRGANIRYLMDFKKDFPDTKDIMMMQNYRSTPQITACVNSLISKNHFRIDKALIPTRPAGQPVLCHYAKSDRDQADWILSEIDKLHGRGVPYRDITVLYRAHYQTRALETEFIEKKVPYTIYSGVRFFDRMEIKDALCYLRIIAYRDDLSFRRIINQPKRNIGKRRLGFLEEYVAAHGCSLYRALEQNAEEELFKNTGARKFLSLIDGLSGESASMTISDLLSAVLDRSGYEKMMRTEGSQERLDNLAELKASVYDFETSFGEDCSLDYYLSRVALLSNADAVSSGASPAGAEPSGPAPSDAAGRTDAAGGPDADAADIPEPAADKVKFMTVHAAKGLEFPYVFLCGMNEGIFPSRRVMTLAAMEEERRLAFVAMTRAENGLYLSEAEGRSFDGSPMYPSRFLLDIDQELMEFTHAPSESLIQAAQRHISIASRKLLDEDPEQLFPEGTRVHHQIFGDGTVTALDMDKRVVTIQFDTIRTPRRISFKAGIRRIE